ncbi:hypothetical protein [Planktothrix sp.]
MTTETTETTQEKTTKKSRGKRTSEDGTSRKQITLNESETMELKALADTLQMSENDLIKVALQAILNNANNIVMSQEKTAYPIEMIATEGIKRYTNQLINQENVGSQNAKIAEAYETLKAIQEDCKRNNKKPPFRSISSKLATTVGTNYNTVKRWLELNHPEELES